MEILPQTIVENTQVYCLFVLSFHCAMCVGAGSGEKMKIQASRVIKRIYLYFMKIVNSYFSITMIFPLCCFQPSSLHKKICILKSLFSYFSVSISILLTLCGVHFSVFFSCTFHSFALHIM